MNEYFDTNVFVGRKDEILILDSALQKEKVCIIQGGCGNWKDHLC